MKNLALTLLMCPLMLIVHAQAGRVNVYFSGFNCDRETWDDALQLDGKGDEVFITFKYIVSDARGNVKLKGEYKTPIYGDATGSFSNRISVGSCVDVFGGQKGGIKEGDRYSANDILFQFDISDNDILTITPIIWEWDPGQNITNTFLARLNEDTSKLSYETAKFLGSNNGDFSPFVQTVGDISKFIFPATLFLSPQFYSFVQNAVGKQETRPIGMTTDGNFLPKVMIMNAQLMTNLMKLNIGYGMGVVPVYYNELALGNTREHGNYTLLIRTEFIPSPVTNTEIIVAPTTTQYTIPATKTINQTVLPTTVQTTSSLLNTSNTTTTNTENTGSNSTSNPATSTQSTTSPTTTTTNPTPTTSTNTNQQNPNNSKGVGKRKKDQN